MRFRNSRELLHDVLPGANEIRALGLFYVHRRYAHVPTHLFSDAHKTMREDAELNGVEFGSDLRSQTLSDGDLDVTAISDLRGAVWFDQQRAQIVHDDDRTAQSISRRQRTRLIHVGILTTTLEVYRCGLENVVNLFSNVSTVIFSTVRSR